MVQWCDDWFVNFANGDTIIVEDADLNGLSEHLVVHYRTKTVMSIHRMTAGWKNERK